MRTIVANPGANSGTVTLQFLSDGLTHELCPVPIAGMAVIAATAFNHAIQLIHQLTLNGDYQAAGGRTVKVPVHAS